MSCLSRSVSAELSTKNTFPISASSPPRLNKLQREYSKVIDDAKLDSLTQPRSGRHYPHHQLRRTWRIAPPCRPSHTTSRTSLWSREFSSRRNLRLGLEVRTIADVCAGCGKHDADTLGHVVAWHEVRTTFTLKTTKLLCACLPLRARTHVTCVEGLFFVCLPPKSFFFHRKSFCQFPTASSAEIS